MSRHSHRLRRLLLVFGLLTATRGTAQSVPDRGAFVLHIGADTLVIERFARVADTVTGSVSVKGQPRQDYVAITAADASIRSLTVNIFAAGAESGAAPLQRVTVTMRGDSVFADVGGNVQRFATRPGAIMVMNNSFALAEQFTRRARAGGGSADIPGWALSGGTTLTLAVRPVGADSMTLEIAGQMERLRVDRQGRILGAVIPAQRLEVSRVDPAVAASLKLGKVDYSPPPGAPYTANDVTVHEADGITLGGTLTLPTGAHGPLPAVVTITGSGQQDRDEYIPVAGGYRPFRQIADTLGRRGIAVLRLDDRMVGASTGKPGTSADYAHDIEAALAYLRTRADIDSTRLALIGHSEGGMIAPMVAVDQPGLRGIVLLAGPAKNGADIIHYQQRQAIDLDSVVPAAGRPAAYRAAAASLDSLVHRDPWVGFFVNYDPLATARKVRVPALILQGATDHQVTPDQAEMLANAMRQGGDPDVTVRVFPGLDHLFVPDSSGLPSNYGRLATNRMSSSVLGTIADWLARHLNVE